jgi:pimeloyl-ACP methyl ester carboxylesterase
MRGDNVSVGAEETGSMAGANGSQEWREETVRVDDTDLVVLKGGVGKPLLVLHEELGWPGWLKWNVALARSHSLIVPLHPGYSRTPRAEWMTNVRDLAGFYSRFIKEQGLAPLDVIGFSLGGWIAAEMAACNPTQFRKMALVAPMGIRPTEGVIFDFFQMMAPKHLGATVLDPEKTPEFGDLFGGLGPEQYERWEECRAQTARLAWMPFMHNPSLPHLLGVTAGLPTLLVWGREDGIVPLSAGEGYRRAVAGAKLVVFDGCGHRPEIEKTADFIRETEAFLA